MCPRPDFNHPSCPLTAWLQQRAFYEAVGPHRFDGLPLPEPDDKEVSHFSLAKPWRQEFGWQPEYSRYFDTNRSSPPDNLSWGELWEAHMQGYEIADLAILLGLHSGCKDIPM